MKKIDGKIAFGASEINLSNHLKLSKILPCTAVFGLLVLGGSVACSDYANVVENQ